jgi:hypothetical protein
VLVAPQHGGYVSDMAAAQHFDRLMTGAVAAGIGMW